MILNYIKIAIRVFARNKLISAINLLGLSLGIAAFAIILFYVDYEMSYENFQVNHKKIYRICPDKTYVGTPPPLALLIKNGFPEIESVTRIGRSSWSEKVSVKANGNYYNEKQFFFVDSSFFKTFDYELLIGNREDVLNNPFSVVLNEKTALKYFNTIDAVGKTIQFENKSYVVSGIAANIPLNSHFHFDIISPFKGSRNEMFAGLKSYWGSYNFYTYVRFKENISVKGFHDKLMKHAAKEFQEYVGIDFFKELYFQPIQKAHTEIIRGNLEAPVNKTYLFIYIFVAIIILVVASINYINLSIATSFHRAKEVGLRKVVGAYRNSVRKQFIGESIIFSLLALALSFVFIESCTPLINKWYGIQISIAYLDLRFLLLSFIIVVWIGLISGSYPAFVVAALRPIKVLKSGYKGSKTNTSFRNVLLTIQFIISTCLIISAVVINNQMNYIQDLNLGFNRHQVVNIPLHQDSHKASHKFLKQAFSSNANISTISANSFNILDPPFHQTVLYEKGEILESDGVWFVLVDEDFFKTYEIKMLQGETFPASVIDNPLKGYVINKKFASKYFGNENPIGKRLSMRGEKNVGQVVGVVDDFNFLSLHHPIEPLVFSLDRSGYDYLSMRISIHNYQQTIQAIEQKWHELYPNNPFELQTVDTEYQKLYKDESQTGSLVLVFTLLSIIISCMGLFGINSLIIKYRVREIGVRKVFGASIFQIIYTLSTKISKLVLIAVLIAWPIAYYFMDTWLNNFTYRIQIPWLAFILAGLLTFLIAILTVVFQSAKTAKINPAETLKFE